MSNPLTARLPLTLGVLALIAAAALPLSARAAEPEGATASARAEQRIDRREARQQRRIGQGLQSGELTAREAVRLERQQARIERHERQAKADGTVTAAEAARIEHQQDRASRHIRRQKHDAQTQ